MYRIASPHFDQKLVVNLVSFLAPIEFLPFQHRPAAEVDREFTSEDHLPTVRCSLMVRPIIMKICAGKTSRKTVTFSVSVEQIDECKPRNEVVSPSWIPKRRRLGTLAQGFQKPFKLIPIRPPRFHSK
jgi:hypothetical protein